MNKLSERIQKIQNSDLMLLGLAPVLLYGLGYYFTGSQVFYPSQHQVATASMVVSNVGQDQVIGLNDLQEASEDHRIEVEKQQEENRKALKSVTEISSPTTILTDVNKAAANQQVAPPPPEKEEPQTHQQTLPNRTTTRTAQAVAPVQHAAAQADEDIEDPYASFEWKDDTVGLTSQRAQPVSGLQEFYRCSFMKDELVSLEQSQAVRILNEEPIILRNGTTIPKATTMTAFLNFRGNRLYMSVQKIQSRSGTIPVNLNVYDDSYAEGIQMQDINEELDDINADLEEMQNEALSNIRLESPLGGGITLRTRRRNGKRELFIPSTVQFNLAEQ